MGMCGSVPCVKKTFRPYECFGTIRKSTYGTQVPSLRTGRPKPNVQHHAALWDWGKRLVFCLCSICCLSCVIGLVVFWVAWNHITESLKFGANLLNPMCWKALHLILSFCTCNRAGSWGANWHYCCDYGRRPHHHHHHHHQTHFPAEFPHVFPSNYSVALLVQDQFLPKDPVDVPLNASALSNRLQDPWMVRSDTTIRSIRRRGRSRNRSVYLSSVLCYPLVN